MRNGQYKWSVFLHLFSASPPIIGLNTIVQWSGGFVATKTHLFLTVFSHLGCY